MLANGIEVHEFIPQRPPVVMIDKLIFSDVEKVISGFTVLSDCIFCEDGELSASGMVENIAQTAAAGVGYVCKMENKPVPIGFIASIKDLKIHRLPPIGAELITEINITNKIMDITIVKGTITLNNKILAECEMRIFVKPNE